MCCVTVLMDPVIDSCVALPAGGVTVNGVALGRSEAAKVRGGAGATALQVVAGPAGGHFMLIEMAKGD